MRKLQGQQGQAETEDQETDKIARCHPAPPTRPREGPWASLGVRHSRAGFWIQESEFPAFRKNEWLRSTQVRRLARAKNSGKWSAEGGGYAAHSGLLASEGGER